MNTTIPVLSQTAPWNHYLGNPYRTRYAQVGERMFRVSASDLTSIWWVEEITATGSFLSSIGVGLSLAEARKIIAEAVSA